MRGAAIRAIAEAAEGSLMHALEDFGISALLVALAEMGDRTQLLTILLATRYRKPFVIVLGVLVATMANHLLAAAV